MTDSGRANLIATGRAAWRRYFYPASTDFVDGETCELKGEVTLALADCLREALDALEARATHAESTLARILEILAPAVEAVKGATGRDWSITNDKSRCAVASSSYAASVARGVLLRDATAIVASINAVRDLEGMIEEVGK